MSKFRSRMFRVPENKKFNYKPLYWDEEKEEQAQREFEREERLRMERGAFFDQRRRNNTIGGAFRQDAGMPYTSRVARGSGQMQRILMLVAMLSLCALYLIGKVDMTYSFAGILMLLILFVRKMNQAG